MEWYGDGHYPAILPKHSLKWAEGDLAVVIGCDEGSVCVCVCMYSMCTLLYGDQLLIQPTNQCALSIDFYNSFIE